MTQALNKPIKLAKNMAKLSRPQNVLYSGLLSVLVLVLLGGSKSTGTLLYLLIFCLYSLATVFNNFQDIDVDILNHRSDNPLTHEKLPRSYILTYCALLLAGVIALNTLLAQPHSMVYTLFYLLLLYIYSFKKISIQSKGYAAHILLATCYGVLPVMLAESQISTNATSKVFLLAILQLIFLVPLLLAKDYKDEYGDRITGKLTPLLRYGRIKLFKAIQVMIFVQILTAGYAAYTLENPWVLIMGTLLAVCTLYIHAKHGKIKKYYLRIPQLLLLLLAWQII